jgi:hypothetical protein
MQPGNARPDARAGVELFRIPGPQTRRSPRVEGTAPPRDHDEAAGTDRESLAVVIGVVADARPLRDEVVAVDDRSTQVRAPNGAAGLGRVSVRGRSPCSVRDPADAGGFEQRLDTIVSPSSRWGDG